MLTKHDFIRESDIKKKMFGKCFENHDCPELTRHFLNAITLGQTFMDGFSFIRGSSIPLGRWQTNLQRTKEILHLCEMVNLRSMMVSFIHK